MITAIKIRATTTRTIIKLSKASATVSWRIGVFRRKTGYMDEITEELSFPCNTNNPVADILIENKLGMAKNMGIDVSCSLSLPYPCMIRDIDFAIILSNALDNAVYACKSMDAHAEKYIRISGKIQGDFIFLEKAFYRKFVDFPHFTAEKNSQFPLSVKIILYKT